MKDVKFLSALFDEYSTIDCETIPKIFCNHASQLSNFQIWHKRVGHIPYKRMVLLPLPFDSKIVRQNCFCDVCPKAKQQRLPFHLSSITTTSPFKFINVDTWGPYHRKTHTGHRFFLIIVDDFTKATWTHLMVTKDEAMSLIKSYGSDSNLI